MRLEEALITLIIGIYIGASIGFLLSAIAVRMNADEFDPKDLYAPK